MMDQTRKFMMKPAPQYSKPRATSWSVSGIVTSHARTSKQVCATHSGADS